jgi:hypothetical protein
MPVAAAGLADVLVGDSNPVVLLGLCDHPLEEFVVATLDLAIVVQQGAHVCDPAQEPIADLLQLADPEDPRAARRRHLVGEAAAREGGDEELRELELQTRNLTAQLNARGTLVSLQQPAEISGELRRYGSGRLWLPNQLRHGSLRRRGRTPILMG